MFCSQVNANDNFSMRVCTRVFLGGRRGKVGQFVICFVGR